MSINRKLADDLARLAVLVGLGACGGVGAGASTPFGAEWQDDGGASITAVRQRIGSARPAVGVDVAVGVAEDGAHLVGKPLAGGAGWTFPHPLDARPVVAGGVVVGAGGGEVFALDATSGRKLWSAPSGGLPLRGAGDDGSVTAVTLAGVGGKGAVLLAIAHDGRVVRRLETDRDLGVPAVLSGIAFVPWGNQYVSALDLASGGELGRVLLREKTSRAWSTGGALYFGEVGVFRFDDRIGLASKNQASHVAVPSRELPGTPRLVVPGTERLPPMANAQDKIRLFARPSDAAGPLGFDGDRVYATYFRLVMGLTAQDGKLAWVHTHEGDVLGGAAAVGALVVCDDRGKLTVLDAKSGAPAGEMDLGAKLRACVVQIDGYRAPGATAGAAPLAAQLSAALVARDPQLVTAKRLLLRELATLESEEATKTLIELASDPVTPPELVIEARTALASRRNGAQYMLAALERHYDFLRDVLRGPPVGPLAEALGAMRDARGAPLLAAHLLDPQSTDEDVKQAAAALALIGTPAEAVALKQFFALTRASAPSDDVALAALSAGQALLRVGGPEGRAVVDAAAKDPQTVAVLQPRLAAILDQPR